ncbi:MAG: response regulator transcription factor [Phycisphaerae bacterium]|nr:response regulator transcription factor [Saprospiraceae bacterium]
MTNTLSCLIIEDEPLAAGILEDYVQQVSWLRFVGRCPDALAAAEALREQPVDAIFLDIHLPGLKGLDFLRTLSHPPQVILTTAYHEYAIESYELGVVDYLLKPIDFERFLKAVQKLKMRSVTATATATITRPFRFFNVNKKMVRVWLDEIQYAESLKEYVRLCLSDGKSIITKMPLGDLENSFEGMGFVRAHRSFLVAMRHVEAYSATELTVAGKEIPIGRQYRDTVQAMIPSY